MANPSGGSGGGKAPPNGWPVVVIPRKMAVGNRPPCRSGRQQAAERHRGRSLQAAGYCFQGIEGDNGSGGGEAPARFGMARLVDDWRSC